LADVVAKEVRSRMMSGIRGKDTLPEMLVRRALHALGFRYRLHAKALPGKPDIVLRKYRAAIFVQGCFWHGHDCSLFKLPSTRPEFWRSKIRGNVMRDARNHRALILAGWRTLDIWECSLKGRSRKTPEQVALAAARWLSSNRRGGSIRGSA